MNGAVSEGINIHSNSLRQAEQLKLGDFDRAGRGLPERPEWAAWRPRDQI